MIGKCYALFRGNYPGNLEPRAEFNMAHGEYAFLIITHYLSNRDSTGCNVVSSGQCSRWSSLSVFESGREADYG